MQVLLSILWLLIGGSLLAGLVLPFWFMAKAGIKFLFDASRLNKAVWQEIPQERRSDYRKSWAFGGDPKAFINVDGHAAFDELIRVRSEHNSAIWKALKFALNSCIVAVLLILLAAFVGRP